MFCEIQRPNAEATLKRLRRLTVTGLPDSGNITQCEPVEDKWQPYKPAKSCNS